MNKTEQLESLFTEFGSLFPDHNGRLIKDGIINPTEYEKQKIKILFIAKEPNNPNHDLGDFREEWKKKAEYMFAYRIAEWTHGILNGFPMFSDIFSHYEKYIDLQQKVALINVKKIGGGGVADGLVIMEYLQKAKAVLLKQIKLISPDLIILGLSEETPRNFLFENVNWIDSGYNIDVGRWNSTKIIDFYHPSSRNAPSASYSLLQNVIQSKVFKDI